MAVREVLLLGNPALRKPSAPASLDDQETAAILGDVQDTLEFLRIETGLGRGLAAPQIGRLHRIIGLSLGDRRVGMINPEITFRSDATFRVWDSCFCFDLAFYVEVERHREIDLTYTAVDGTRVVERFRDDLSELLQHEIDHLDGVLAVDRPTVPGRIMMREEYDRRG